MVMRKRAADRAVAVKAAPRKRRVATQVQAPSASPYAVHPGVFALQRWIRNLKANTGRSLTEWVGYIREAGPPDERSCRVWLKHNHNIGGSSGLWLAASAHGNHAALAEATPEGYLALAPQYVERMFAGKARLWSLYSELLITMRGLGGDVQICPCKTAISLYRRRLFARITPHSPRRLELGLSLAEEPHTARLLKSTAGGCEQITHFVALMTTADLDLQVKRWLKQAYDRGN
jgi:hypothetical protein